ncbi:MAG: hypothetical protein EOM91_24745 [Sphingobacteriia bacterium]|nr:hypothetical protein [Sphingobacteriia bacterium]
MHPTRDLIGYALVLSLLTSGPVASAPIAAAATGPGAAAITTPPPGSRERRALLDAVRAELTPLTGPDLVFVVTVLRVQAGWAWLEAAPQSADGSNRYEPVTALLHLQDGRWAVQVLGPCDAEDDPACVEATDPERLIERYPTLPAGLVPGG